MRQEHEQLPEEETTPEEDAAAFESGFSEAHGDELPANEQEAKHSPKGGADEQGQGEEGPMFAGLTETELKNLLSKASKYDELEGRVFGKFGEVQRTIKQMQESGIGGQRMTLTADKLKRLSEFDPEFAEAIAADLSEILYQTGPAQPDQAPQQDPDAMHRAVESRVSEATDQLAKQFEAKLLSIKHPDWQDVARSPDFDMWKSTLDQQTQHDLTNAWDASFIASKLDEFKTWKGRSSKRQTNQRRLEQAITPNGAQGLPDGQTDDDAFLSGFNSMRGS
jgi:hypothetical protein